jgi:hypothetical protein
MGFLTVLRTGLAYFLALELKELEADHISDLGSDTSIEDEADQRQTINRRSLRLSKHAKKTT